MRKIPQDVILSMIFSPITNNSLQARNVKCRIRIVQRNVMFILKPLEKDLLHFAPGARR